MKYKVIISLIVLPLISQAQTNFENFLQTIEANNKSLSAANKMAEAERLEAKTGIYLTNPELSYDYLIGNSENYSEMIVSQSFDFPTTYIHKNKIANIKEYQASTEYRSLRLDIFNEASEYYINLHITSRKLEILQELDTLLLKLQSNAERKLELGETNILETNRIRTESAKNKVDVNILYAKSEELKKKLVNLNGGNIYPFITDERFIIGLPELNDSVINRMVNSHPLNLYKSGNLEKHTHEIKLQKANSLPKMMLGYRLDKNAENSFNGVVTGISIPLFENKNTIKLAKAQQVFAYEELTATQLNIRTEIEKLIQEYTIISAALSEIEELITNQDIPGLVLKAYETGQINYTEFFSEYSNYKTTQLYVEDIRLKSLILQMKLFLLHEI